MESYECELCQQEVPITNRTLHSIRCKRAYPETSLSRTSLDINKAVVHDTMDVSEEISSNPLTTGTSGVANEGSFECESSTVSETMNTNSTDHHSTSPSYINPTADECWSCPRCSFLNAPQLIVCEACTSDMESQPSPQQQNTWVCPRCTLLNPKCISSCAACSMIRPADKVIKERLIADDDDDDDDDDGDMDAYDLARYGIRSIADDRMFPGTLFATTAASNRTGAVTTAHSNHRNGEFVISIASLVGLTAGLLYSARLDRLLESLRHSRAQFGTVLLFGCVGAGAGALTGIVSVWLQRAVRRLFI